MSDVYIKTVNGGETTSPTGNEGLPLDDGSTSTWIKLSNIAAYVAGLAQTFTGIKIFGSAGAVGKLKIAGNTSGNTILDATAVASGTLTLPAATDTLVARDTTDTLTNKTLTSPVMTTPQVNDTSADHQYVVAVNELAADRTVTLPLLTGNDEFVFKDHAVTLANKTLTAPTIADFTNAAHDHGDADDGGAIVAASTTVAGAVELTIASEINTGTDATRAMTPDSFAGSNFGIRYMVFSLNGTTALTTSDKDYKRIPAAFTGMNLVSVTGECGTGAAGASSSGTPTFTVKNVTDNQQMLSTNLTIDANEYTSASAATAAVINATYDDVVTDDLIEVACTVAGTGVTYAKVTLGFQLP